MINNMNNLKISKREIEHLLYMEHGQKIYSTEKIISLLFKYWNLEIKEHERYDKTYLDFTVLILEELLKESGEKYFTKEFVYPESGGYKTTIYIYNQGLKVGKPPYCNIDFYLPQLLQRRLNKVDVENNICIEVMNIVTPLDQIDPSINNIDVDEIVYQLYKEVRELGYIWFDCKENNVGQLLSDNVPFYNDMDSFCSSNLGVPNSYGPYKKKGDYVILDHDFIIHESKITDELLMEMDENFMWWREYENRYQRELHIKKL